MPYLAGRTHVSAVLRQRGYLLGSGVAPLNDVVKDYPALTDAHEALFGSVQLIVVRGLPEGLGAVLDGGTAPGGRPSTIVDLTCAPPRVLRDGAVPIQALEPFLPDLEPL